MAKLTKEEMLSIVESNIEKLEKKEFNVYFFVMDTKNTASGSLEYIYDTAMLLKEAGYNVTMLHQGTDFVGVTDWLGDSYAVLPNKEIENDNVEITPSDFLIIPDIFTNVMVQTKKLPCKRVMLVTNYNYISEFMPVGVTPYELGITDAIVTTNQQKNKLEKYFPELRVHVVTPFISPKFRNNTVPQKLVINIAAKDSSDTNRIIKTFYWLYPLYKWISFRDLRGLSQDAVCESFRDGAITVWVDEDTNFGYEALEALRCGTIVLAKTTKHPSDWMLDTTENGGYSLTKNCLWFDDIDDVPELLSKVIRAWITDKVPDDVYKLQETFSDKYTREETKSQIDEVYGKLLFDKRKKEFIEVREQVKNNTLKSAE